MITRLNSLGFNELVAEHVVTGSAATAITFDGLDINADGGYTIVAELVSIGNTSEYNVLCYANNDTTSGNYAWRYIYSSDTSLLTNGGTTVPYFAAMATTSGKVTFLAADASFVNGNFVYNTNEQYSNAEKAQRTFIRHNQSQTNITRLDFASTVALGIGIGSKIKIYRWKQGIKTLNSLAQGRLVWEHTVTGSAVTTVTATGLDILKDGSYKVVCGIVSAAGSPTGIKLFVNSDVTESNYSNRYITSSGTSVSTSSYSSPDACPIGSSGEISLSIIDMSIVDGYLVWNVNASRANTTGAFLYFVKHNVSQTNITRLDFTCATASGIGVGSKFYIFRTN